MSDRYEFRDTIGEGGLGTVYRAYDRNLEREVAVKRVLRSALRQDGDPDDMASSLLKEARTLSALMHPNIVTVFDAGEDADGPYVVMELLKGENLESTVARGALPLEDFDRLVQQTLEGLIAAHAVDLVHRDLKPANLMVVWMPSGKFQIKILDFGIAQFSRQPDLDTSSGTTMLGSIHFMAPEQFESKAAGPRADIYALGAIYYFALTGLHPFRGDTPAQVMASHLQHDYNPLGQLRPDLPEWIPEWIDWMMSRDPDQRPASAVDALDAFQRQQGNPTKSSPAPAATSMPSPQQDPSTEPAQPQAAPKKMMKKAGGQGGASPGQSTSQQPPKKMMKKAAPAVPSPLSHAAAEQVHDVQPVTPVTAAYAPSEDMVLTEDEARAMDGSSVQKVVRNFPKWAYVTIPLLIVAGLGLGAWTLINNAAKNERQEQFTAFSKQDPPTGNLEDVKLIARFLDDPDQGGVAAKLLSRFEGDDPVAVDQEIIRLLKREAVPEVIRHLIRVARRREIPEATPLLIDFTRHSDDGVRRAAWSALASTARPREVALLVERLDQVDDAERPNAIDSIIDLAKGVPDADERVGMLMIAYRSAEGPETKRALFDIMAQLGGDRAWRELEKMLTGNNQQLRRDAASALARWPTHDPVPALLKILEQEEDPAMRRITSTSAAMLAPFPGSYPQEQLFEFYENALGFVTDRRETMTIHTGIANLFCEQAVDFFEGLPSDNPSSAASSTSIRQIRKSLDKAVTVSNGDVFEFPMDQLHMMTQGPRVTQEGLLMNWVYVDDWIGLHLFIPEPGKFRFVMEQASDTEESGSLFVVATELPREIRTIGTGSVEKFEELDLGTYEFEQPGHYRVWLQPYKVPGYEFLRVRSLRILRN